MTKRILYFFPANPLKKNAGSMTRALELLYYFKNKNFHVDYVYSRNQWGGSISKVEAAALIESGLAERVFKVAKKPERREFFAYIFQYKIPSLWDKFSQLFKKRSIPDYASRYTKLLFNHILKNETYDYIIISYAFWAYLVKDNPLVKGAKTIIDTHDLLTAQYQTLKRFDRGKALNDELRRIDLFDEVWTLSADEHYLFSQLCKSKIRLVPFTIENRAERAVPIDEKKFDIIYVAGNNLHNITSISWFFTNVYPHLNKDIKILTIGAISDYVPNYANITKIPFVENLTEYYNNSKLAICPMLTGTGIKIKVVEALSYGLPVVCSLRGIDGLFNKTQNGCIVSYSATEFAENIKELLENKDFYTRYQTEGLRYVQLAHSRDYAYKILNSCFEN